MFPGVRKNTLCRTLVCEPSLVPSSMPGYVETSGIWKQPEDNGEERALFFTFQPWYQPQPTYPFLRICKPEGQSHRDVGLRRRVPRQVRSVLAF